jgi:hypothetical protein
MNEYADSVESVEELTPEEEHVHPLVEMLRSRPVSLLELLQHPRLL